MSVTETTMSNWYIPYSEPGSRPFGKDSLSDLFDFLRIVIWSRMVDESAASRLMFEPSLNAPELTEAVRYRDLKKMQAAQLVADIQLQPWHPSFEKPFSRWLMEKVLGAKYASSYHFSDAMTRKAMRLTRTEAIAYSEAVERSCADEIDERKKKFIFEFEARLRWLPTDWLSLVYQQHAENTAAQYSRLKKVAFRYYTNQFKRFCLSQEIQDIREKVFYEGRHADHAYFQNLVINFVSEKLDSGKYDVSPFTKDMKSLRQRNQPNAKNH